MKACQFTTRGLLLCVAVIAVLLSLRATRIRQAKAIDDAILEYTREGGFVRYAWQLDESGRRLPEVSSEDAPKPTVFEYIFGTGNARCPISASFAYDTPNAWVPLRLRGNTGKLGSDRELSYLKKLPTLRLVDLSDAKWVTDRTVYVLVDLPMLEIVHLDGTSITGLGFFELRNSPRLRVVQIGADQVPTTTLSEFKQARPDVMVSLKAG